MLIRQQTSKIKAERRYVICLSFMKNGSKIQCDRDGVFLFLPVLHLGFVLNFKPRQQGRSGLPSRFFGLPRRLFMKKGIMLVDDDPDDREEFSDVYLAQFPGELLYFAENGEKALETLEDLNANKTPLCLIVLDLNMPILNGTQTLRRIKEDDRFREIPVVIYSTSVNAIEREECFRLGALDYLVKPSSFSDSVEIAKKLKRICKLY